MTSKPEDKIIKESSVNEARNLGAPNAVLSSLKADEGQDKALGAGEANSGSEGAQNEAEKADEAANSAAPQSLAADTEALGGEHAQSVKPGEVHIKSETSPEEAREEAEVGAQVEKEEDAEALVFFCPVEEIAMIQPIENNEDGVIGTFLQLRAGGSAALKIMPEECAKAYAALKKNGVPLLTIRRKDLLA